jgi:hypothetical protein
VAAEVGEEVVLITDKVEQEILLLLALAKVVTVVIILQTGQLTQSVVVAVVRRQ